MTDQYTTGDYDFEIEDGFEFAERDTVQSKYPFDKLEVGQSFFVPNRDSKHMSGARNHWKKKFPDRHWVCKKDQKLIDGAMVSGTRIGRTQ